MVKPIRPSELKSHIQHVLAGSEILPSSPPVAPCFHKTRRSLHILLAEDNGVSRELAVSLLKKHGHRVESVMDGDDVLNALDRDTFDLVLMDVQMPRMNGIQATRAIRQKERERGGHIPIVAMTALAMAKDHDECLNAGMDAYIAKPISLPEFFKVVEDLFVRQSPTAPIASVDTSGSTVTMAEAPVFNRRDALALVNGDEALLKRILALFLQDAPRQLARLKEAIESKDREIVWRQAHSLKGAAANLAFKRFRACALELEDIARTGEDADIRERFDHLSNLYDQILAELTDSR